MKRKLMVLLIIWSLLLTNISFASVNGIQEDDIFTTKTEVLYSDKHLTVWLQTVNPATSICIHSFQLQKYNGYTWTPVTNNQPDYISGTYTSTSLYETYDYSEYITTTGKYRVKLQVEADGNYRTIFSTAYTY